MRIADSGTCDAERGTFIVAMVIDSQQLGRATADGTDGAEQIE
jgi:hypothetical protein